MTAEHFVSFWDLAVKFAEEQKDAIVVIRPKDPDSYKNLSSELTERFLGLKEQINGLDNLFIVDSLRWSFIETIGTSDVVISQGMTSFSMIAIICGIEGLYLDQANYKHPFSRLYRDILVFDDPKKINLMLKDIILDKRSPLKEVEEKIMRNFDAYADDRGIDIFRNVLSGQEIKNFGEPIYA